MKKILVSLLSILLLLSLVGCKENINADRVIYGNIYTSNDENKFAEALAIKDGEFIYVGNRKDVEDYIGDNTIIDTFSEDELITAGFIDGHNHVTSIMVGQMNDLCSISQGATKEICYKEIKDYVDAHPEIEFYYFIGWEMQNFSNEKYGCPTSDMLDGITDKPILAFSSDGHSYWVNNALMKLANVTKESKSADGGVIMVDENGEPLGIFKDTAQYIIDDVKPEYEKEVYKKGIELADDTYIKEGYVYRFQAFDNAQYNALKYPAITALEEMDKEGKLKAYTQSSFVISNTDDAIELVDEAIKLRDETKGGNFEVTAVKIFLDGIIENAGAYLSEPYNEETVGISDYYGSQRWKGEDAIKKMGQIIAKANKAGMSVHFHGMGDQAVSDILTAIEYAADEIGIEKVRECRNAIAHLALVKESDYVRFKDLNVIAVFNPWCNKDPGYYDLQVALIGQDRADNQYPMGSFVNAGVNCAFGTDYGASFTYNVVECFHALTTRMYYDDDPDSLLRESEKLSREETLKIMTIGGAYQLRNEDVFGSIEVGKDASLCVFSKDLLTIPDSEIMSTTLVNSMFKGAWTYDTE